MILEQRTGSICLTQEFERFIARNLRLVNLVDTCTHISEKLAAKF